MTPLARARWDQSAARPLSRTAVTCARASSVPIDIPVPDVDGMLSLLHELHETMTWARIAAELSIARKTIETWRSGKCVPTGSARIGLLALAYRVLGGETVRRTLELEP